jgi:hypothetical protein
MTATMIAPLLWFLGFSGLVAIAVATAHRARARGQHLERRSATLAAALMLASLAALGAWAWSVQPASDGAARRVREGLQAQLTVEQIEINLGAELAIGYADASPPPLAAATSLASPALTMTRHLLPGAGPAELVRLRRRDDGLRWRMDPAPGVVLRIVSVTDLSASRTSVRAALEAACTAAELQLFEGSATAAQDLVAAATPAFAVAAVVCDRSVAKRAVLLGAIGGGAATRLVLLPLQGPRWQPPRLLASSGALIHIEGGATQLPGLRSWNLGGDASASWVLAIPDDPRQCEPWGAGAQAAATGTCTLRRNGTVLRAVTLAPDLGAVRDRALLAALIIAGPAIALLLGLTLSRASWRRSALVATALALAVLSAGLAAVLCWRLLWAHRIDLMRDDAVVGWRVFDNQLAALLVGAALAGLAAAQIATAALLRRAARDGLAMIAWLLWLAAGLACGPMADTGGPGLTSLAAHLPLCAASALAALAPSLLHRLSESRSDWYRSPTLQLFGLAVVAATSKLFFPGIVLLKLGLAYAVVVVGHAALRAAVSADQTTAARLLAVLATTAAATAMLILDSGVGLAVTAVGLLGAMVVAGHDAMYSETVAPRLGMLEREHARIVATYGLSAAALAIALIGWGLVASDRLLIEHTADLVLHIPVAVAALFAIGALLARHHRQPWPPWLAAALAALALWGARQPAIERVMAGHGVSAHRVSAVVDPGYSLLRDERRFMAQTSAWQAATLPRSDDGDLGDASAAEQAYDRGQRWQGQGLFGSRVTDPGVSRSIDNDYLPILIARELGVAGLVRTTLLLLGLILAIGALARARLPHASAAARSRSLVLAVASVLCVYQPLAALGILPLTGISWPGLGIDSPADLWIAFLGLSWCLFGDERSAQPLSHIASDHGSADERIRATPRLRRARRLAAMALVACGLAGVAMVARAGDSALGRTGLRTGAGSGDPRVDRAIAYAQSLACGTASPGLPDLTAVPSDDATTRFHRELIAQWRQQRHVLVGHLTAALQSTVPPATSHRRSADRDADSTEAAVHPSAPWLAACQGRVQRWRFERLSEDVCRATFDAGWPQVRVELRPLAAQAQPMRADLPWTASCRVDLARDPIAQLVPANAPIPQRVRLVSRAMGDAAEDLGEILVGSAVVRLRRGAPAFDASAPATALGFGFHVASRVQLGVTTAIEIDDQVVRLRGSAKTWTSTQATPQRASAWVTTSIPAAAELTSITLMVGDAPASPPALFRPRRSWPSPTAATAMADPATVDPILADDILAVSDRARRLYPYGSELPVLGWVNPYAVDRSLGLDGWIHAALAPKPSPPTAEPASCGLLDPPPIAPTSVCTPSPLDGVLECRVSLQPELVLALTSKIRDLLRDPAPVTGKAVTPLRAAVVVLRGDTGEILAHTDTTWGRVSSAYAPRSGADERSLIRLREDRDPLTGEPGVPGDSDAERVDWNLPIAVGSTLKPVVARAAELAFPALAEQLVLGFTGVQPQCKGRRGSAEFAAIVGHCPPTSLQSEPAASDLHDFLGRSPNWYQAALGIIGLGLPDGGFATGDRSRSFLELVTSDLSSWPSTEPLMIRDRNGPILGKRGVVVAGLRRTALWQGIEALLGRPLCTLGDRKSCSAAASRRDICAARALPLARPGADLRQLVALGPDRFDFYGDVRAGAKSPQTTVPTREYLQWLRGSGIHSVGSLAQLTDAFSRVIYEPELAPPILGDQEVGTAFRLAASWFPSPVVGATPTWRCVAAKTATAAKVRGRDGGLCAAISEGGTAHAALARAFEDDRVILYGGKTGTIDSLAAIARQRSSCESWNRRHTLAGQPLTEVSQPGWLACGKPTPDDSLFVIAFSVRTGSGALARTIPLTLGIALQRSGKGAAARFAPHAITAIADYFDASK